MLKHSQLHPPVPHDLTRRMDQVHLCTMSFSQSLLVARPKGYESEPPAPDLSAILRLTGLPGLTKYTLRIPPEIWHGYGKYIPPGNQPWLAAKSPMNGAFIRKNTDKWSLVHRHVWLPVVLIDYFETVQQWLGKSMLIRTNMQVSLVMLNYTKVIPIFTIGSQENSCEETMVKLPRLTIHVHKWVVFGIC